MRLKNRNCTYCKILFSWSIERHNMMMIKQPRVILLSTGEMDTRNIETEGLAD